MSTDIGSSRRSWLRWSLCPELMTERDWHNEQRVNVATVLWVVTYLALTFVVSAEYVDGWFALVLSAVPAILGAIVVVRYVQFVREADELLRKIQTEALAIGFGAGMFFTLTYALFEQIGAPRLEPAFVVIVMGAGWIWGLWRGARLYR